MARKVRIEFPGALYHVLNRGNYRQDLFRSPGEAVAFERSLEEGVALYGWRVHAYAIMRNHYHLAIETPDANLVDGMHWLQSTFATRFNRFRKENGHLFQGRYQSLLVEDTAALVRLVNYIHLNPVRSKIVPPDQVALFRWGSLSRFLRGNRFEGLNPSTWMEGLGLKDNPDGWAAYIDQLRGLAGDSAAQERDGFSTMSKGWAIGTSGWKRSMAKSHAEAALSPGLSTAEARMFREAKWNEQLDALMSRAGKGERDLAESRNSAPWKVEMAHRLRHQSGAAVVWIARALKMGKPDSVRHYLSVYSREKRELDSQNSA